MLRHPSNERPYNPHHQAMQDQECYEGAQMEALGYSCKWPGCTTIGGLARWPQPALHGMLYKHCEDQDPCIDYADNKTC